jgi:hypothetical protein
MSIYVFFHQIYKMDPSAPINVYRVSSAPHTNGWIILSLVLTVIILILLFVWPLSLNNCENRCQGCTCYGPYGVQAGTDALTLNTCGTGGNLPCAFTVNSLAAAEQQCAVYSDICQAFTYNARTSTMNIVQVSNTFVSGDGQTNLFVRQSGII